MGETEHEAVEPRRVHGRRSASARPSVPDAEQDARPDAPPTGATSAASTRSDPLSPDSLPDSRPDVAVPVASSPRATPLRRVLSVVGKVLAWVVVVVCVAALLLLVVVPRVTGSTPYTVLTGSMSPLMPPGTMVVVKPKEFSLIAVGDVVTYQIESGEPAVVTHRVAAINVTDGGVRLTTQGDANPSPDPVGVREEQVRGVVWYWIPLIGYATSVGDGESRLLIARVIGGALILYALVTVVQALRGRRKTDSEANGDDIERGTRRNRRSRRPSE